MKQKSPSQTSNPGAARVMPIGTLDLRADLAAVTEPAGRVTSAPLFPLPESPEPGKNTTKFLVNQQAGKNCAPKDLVDVFGRASTDEQGQAKIFLSDYLCDPNLAQRLFETPVFVVATPKVARAAIVTLTTEIVDGGNDVLITAQSWGADGALTEDVSFDFLCRTPVRIEQDIK